MSVTSFGITQVSLGIGFSIASECSVSVLAAVHDGGDLLEVLPENAQDLLHVIHLLLQATSSQV